MLYTVKNWDGEKYLYNIWSSLIEAPVTYLMEENEFILFYKEKYGENAVLDWIEGNRRKKSLTEALSLYNKKYKKKMQKEIYFKIYKKNSWEYLLKLTLDIVEPKQYLYKSNIIQVLFSIHHNELGYFIVGRNKEEIINIKAHEFTQERKEVYANDKYRIEKIF